MVVMKEYKIGYLDEYYQLHYKGETYASKSFQAIADIIKDSIADVKPSKEIL